MTTRRKLLLAAAGAVTTLRAAIAQQKIKIWRIGFLASRHVNFIDSDSLYGPFRRGMRDLGYVEGKHFKIEWRSSEGNNEHLPALAVELANLNVDIIVTSTVPAIRAAQKATTTIPIVMGGTGDPVASGFVNSLARPGGNITGLSNLSPDLRLKQLELLIALIPKLTRVAFMPNPSNPVNIATKERLILAAQKRQVRVLHTEARTPQEIDTAFISMQQQNVEGLIVALDAFLYQQHWQIAELTTKYRLPAVGGDSIYPEAGMLMSYGVNSSDQWQRAATYVDKILKGAKPSDLPIEQPTKFELVINLQAARRLGVTVPPTAMVQATRVIE